MWTKHSPNLGEDRIISSVPTLQRASKQQRKTLCAGPTGGHQVPNARPRARTPSDEPCPRPLGYSG